MSSDLRATLLRGLPVAMAIGVFGVIYGAVSVSVIGPGPTIASSLLMFSGAAQFAMVSLVDGGAGPAALVTAVSLLALRHVPLAAVVRPRLAVGRGRRAVLGLGLLDETAGLALAETTSATATLAAVGLLSYVAWVAGTLGGVLGADLAQVGPLASVVFLLLFIGLAAVTCRGRRDVARAAVAAVATAVLVLVVPSVDAFAAVLVAAGVAAASADRRR